MPHPTLGELYENYTQLRHERLHLVYKGPVTRDILAELAAVLRRQPLHRPQARRAFAVFVELAQNIQRYSADRFPLPPTAADTPDVGIGLLLVRECENTLHLTAANPAAVDTAQTLADTIALISGMHRPALNTAFRERRKTRRAPSQQPAGAGLGLYEIARRSDKPLECCRWICADGRPFVAVSAAVALAAPAAPSPTPPSP